MPHETELKLSLVESAHRHFLRHPLLKQASGRQTSRLVSLYYDTPELALHERGIALRLRAHDQLWLQTVKCAGKSAGGLSARPEWETPYLGHFDFSVIDDADVRDWLDKEKVKGRLAPVFETNFQRMSWRFEPAPGTRIELAFDRGWIAAAGRREAISELELELLEGDGAQLFALARALAARIALVPTPDSKAERGYRLYRGQLAAPVKAAPIALSGGEDPVTAFDRIALACLDQLQRNHPGASTSDDPEYIHQMRVAARRLRAALRLFAPLLPPDYPAPIVAALRELMGILGQARDLDVLQAEIAEPVLQSLPDEPRLAALVGVITERRFDRRRAAVDFLRSPRFGLIMLATLEALHGRPERVDGDETASCLIAFADERLRRLRRKALKLAAAARSDDPPSLHALRIGIKRLRYALEFFAPLAAPKAMNRVLGRLARLQETLGQINDLANAGDLLMDCAGDDASLREAVALIGGWHGPRHQQLLSAVPRELKRFRKLTLPKLRP